MKIYYVLGNSDLILVNYVHSPDLRLLNHVINDGASLDRGYTLNLEIGLPDDPDDWIATDCPHLSGYGLMLSNKAVSVFGPVLTDAGYLLNTSLPRADHYKLFICERLIDAIDQERSDIKRFTNGGVWRLRRYELRAELLQDMHVFRLKHRRNMLFVSDQFVRLVQEHELTGFEFTEIWCSETGSRLLHGPLERSEPEGSGPDDGIDWAAVRRQEFRDQLTHSQADEKGRSGGIVKV